ncbi:MAG: 3-deoxy-manno-octulosonate cytidylyltransferase [Bacteroidales bacterium]|nr:3-deoxy-manno-octulosonate cytidylyltransferase [Bacteroidales bacterium]
MTEFLAIIPARYASSRFPGKPLAMLGKKPMIQWVYERAFSLFDHLLVATDDERIRQAVVKFGGRVLMTSPEHSSGTERCAEAAVLYEQQSGLRFSHVVNIQGDEPLIQQEQLQTLISCFQTPGTDIATLIREVTDREELENYNVVKVVVDRTFRALYFSRAPIPFVRNRKESDARKLRYYAHIGLYAFRREVLEQVAKLTPSDLELAESLEQLRWMEHGMAIRTAVTHLSSIGVDTPEDLELIRKQGSY